jgi:hypothetical protein
MAAHFFSQSIFFMLVRFCPSLIVVVIHCNAYVSENKLLMLNPQVQPAHRVSYLVIMPTISDIRNDTKHPGFFFPFWQTSLYNGS